MKNSISVLDLLNVSNPNIIDIRSVQKYNDNHILNAKNIPDYLLLSNPEKYLSKDEIYYIYCQKGINSGKLCLRLLKKGYKVVNIIGGYEAWVLLK